MAPRTGTSSDAAYAAPARFRVQRLGFKLSGSGFGAGFGVWSLESRNQGLGFRV